MIFAGKQKITENHHCGTMVFARQKIFQKKKMIMPETEGDFALSLEYFSLKTTFCKWQFSPNIFPEVVASPCFFFQNICHPKHMYWQNQRPGRDLPPKPSRCEVDGLHPGRSSVWTNRTGSESEALCPVAAPLGLRYFFTNFLLTLDQWQRIQNLLVTKCDEDGQGK